jgi:hypothetical protein
MGTSSSSSGASGKNPLIPAWIPSNDSDIQVSPPSENVGQETSPNITVDEGKEIQPKPNTNRYKQPKSDFNVFLRSKGKDKSSLKRAFSGYIKSASGGSVKLAHRMYPASVRITGFWNTINDIKQTGTEVVLKRFNIGSYINSPLVDILSALSDVVFKDTGKLFESTQDDSIVKQAYVNTIVRICEIESLELDKLTNESIELMVAIFIEETIVQRVICDIGAKITEIGEDATNFENLIEMEENVYQVVNGLVRTQIMPEIIATQLGEQKDIEKRMENIYRIAFDAMANTQE